MSSRSGKLPSRKATPNHGGDKRRSGPPYRSETQIQAYLIARDVLRRMQRTASLMLAYEDVTPNRPGSSPSPQGWHRAGDSDPLAKR